MIERTKKERISASILAITSLLVAVTAHATLISGRVVDGQNRPMSNVRVTAAEVVLSNCCPEPTEVTTAADGTFSIGVTGGVYAVFTAGFSRWNPAGKGVDTRSADVSGLVLQMKPGLPDFLPNDPPRSALITVSIPGDSGMAHVTGAAGAVPPSSFVILVTEETGDFIVLQAAADGSFVADHFGPSGTSILVKADPVGIAAVRAMREGSGRFPMTTHQALGEGEGNLAPLNGTIVRVPEPPSSDATHTPGRRASFGADNATRLPSRAIL